jgi:hypothetical protein
MDIKFETYWGETRRDRITNEFLKAGIQNLSIKLEEKGCGLHIFKLEK